MASSSAARSYIQEIKHEYNNKSRDKLLHLSTPPSHDKTGITVVNIGGTTATGAGGNNDPFSSSDLIYARMAMSNMLSGSGGGTNRQQKDASNAYSASNVIGYTPSSNKTRPVTGR